MHTAGASRTFAWLRPVLLQALIWATLTFAFAALLKLSGPQSWPNALQFAAFNWMPWAVLAPAVFWLARRFPLERGHLLTGIPVHMVGCVACVAVTLSVSTAVAFTGAGAGAADQRPLAADPAAIEGRTAPRAPRTASLAERTARGVEIREARPTTRGPAWWPLLGATLARANFDAAVYLIIVAAAHALAFYQRAQERDRHAMSLAAGLNRAKLDALRLQLQPHFLFNTLNAISTLVHRDPHAADNLIGDLSDLLRLSLQTTDHELDLARELSLLDRYLAIEQARLGDRLRVVRDIDPGVTDALVPTFLLQPLVENAVRHGLEPRLAPGTITIRARRAGQQVQLAVSDDGIGLQGGGSNRARSGIGLRNTEARLRALHGDAAQLALVTPSGGGLEIQITLPYRTVPQVDARPANDAGTPMAAPPHAAPSAAEPNPMPSSGSTLA